MIEDEHISSQLFFTTRLIHAIIVKKVKSNNKIKAASRESERERERRRVIKMWSNKTFVEVDSFMTTAAHNSLFNSRCASQQLLFSSLYCSVTNIIIIAVVLQKLFFFVSLSSSDDDDEVTV